MIQRVILTYCQYLLFIVFCLIIADNLWAKESERYYVGASICKSCHNDTATGNQFGIWKLSGHAKSYARLALNDSTLITHLSGLAEKPYDAPICLGCHTTASDTEDWQRDKTFSFDDGISCEYCHGPGSDYAEWDVMSDKEAAKNAGLQRPDESFCQGCHEHKGSHQARIENGNVIFHHPQKGQKYFDYDVAFKKIRHSSDGPKAALSKPPVKAKNANADYLGQTVCSDCHNTQDTGYISSFWRLSKHADAYGVLTTKEAIAIAGEKGITTPPHTSEECLRCHSTGFFSSKNVHGNDVVDLSQGVSCESCHGPGRSYTFLEQPDKVHNKMPGVDENTCKQCHNGYHGKKFTFAVATKTIEHRMEKPSFGSIEVVPYKTPFNLITNRTGSRLYVVCEASDSLIVIDTLSKRKIAEISVMNLPHGVTLSPDEKKIYVSNRGSDTISVIDAKDFKILGTIEVGDEPHDLLTNQEGTRLVVANNGSHDISIVDLKKGQEIKRLSGGRGTWGLAYSPDKSEIVATNNLSHLVPFRESSLSEITVIDALTMTVKNRIMVPDANLLQGIEYSPDGEFAIVTLLRTKNLVPIVRVLQGWMITNGFGIVWKDGTIDQLLIDGVDNYFADPTDVVITPDGKYGYITGGGVNEVAVIDIKAVKELLEKSTDIEKKSILPNHLGTSEQYIANRIPVGNGPRGLATDGQFVYVADALDDTISVIDISQQKRTAVISLDGPKKITQARRGERLFHNADITYGRQYTCHSCHPDGGIDGLTYDISPDGLGFNPVDNRTLRGILDTSPFKWTGKNVSLNRQCGPRLAVFFTRIDPFTPQQANDLESYIVTIPRNPNRYLGEDGQLTSAQQRGKELFIRNRTNTGKEIPVENRCHTCHSGPNFTNRQVNNVGTASPWDTQGNFDVPHLNNIYETAPYLHDGRSNTLEEIWTVYNPEDKHGITNDMTKDQLNDLIEYLRIL